MASFSDTFDRANNVSLGADWTEETGAPTTGSLSIISNAISSAANSTIGMASWTTPCDTDDQFSEGTIGTAGNFGFFVSVRAEVDGKPKAYGGYANSTTWQIVTYNSAGAAVTVRASGTTTASAAGNVIRLEASGTLYTLKKNGATLGTWNDTGGLHPVGASNRHVGVGISRGSSGVPTFSTWAGGDIAGLVPTNLFFNMF